MSIEAAKEKYNKPVFMRNRLDESKSPSEIKIDLGGNVRNQRSGESNNQ